VTDPLPDPYSYGTLTVRDRDGTSSGQLTTNFNHEINRGRRAVGYACRNRRMSVNVRPQPCARDVKPSITTTMVCVAFSRIGVAEAIRSSPLDAVVDAIDASLVKWPCDAGRTIDTRRRAVRRLGITVSVSRFPAGSWIVVDGGSVLLRIARTVGTCEPNCLSSRRSSGSSATGSCWRRGRADVARERVCDLHVHGNGARVGVGARDEVVRAPPPHVVDRVDDLVVLVGLSRLLADRALAAVRCGPAMSRERSVKRRVVVIVATRLLPK